MGQIEKNKLVLFGAGKIGRSFIGQLFSRGGFEVVFIDVFRPVIDELNRRRNYNVIIKSEKEEVLNISNVRGVLASDENAVINEVANAGIAAVSVGLNGLNGIFPLLAKGLMLRHRTYGNEPLDIIIAENMRNADVYFREQLSRHLPGDYPLERMAGLIETSIGKMVPIMTRKDVNEDILRIFAEPYNTLILNRKGFLNPIPDIKGLAPKENMKAWVDRKLFIHNLGHSAAAYIGHVYDNRFIYMYEALSVPAIHSFVRSAMLQSASVLLREYPEEFTPEALAEHTDDLLSRFQNRYLGDTIFRVGCDLKRKLGPEDRLAGAINKALDHGLPFDKILFALVCGCRFRAGDEEGKMLKDDIEFAGIYEKGISEILKKVCGFNESAHGKIFRAAEDIDKGLTSENIRSFQG